jgi:hypothetical protein
LSTSAADATLAGRQERRRRRVALGGR